ncbi:TRAP transporter permease DctQ, partial [Staphylococcus cohnii]
PALHLSMGLIYLSLPISGGLFIFYSILNILDLIESKKTTSES